MDERLEHELLHGDLDKLKYYLLASNNDLSTEMLAKIIVNVICELQRIKESIQEASR